MSAAYPLQHANSSETKSSAFGTASVVFAVLTVLLPVVFITFFAVKATNDPNEQARAWAPLIIVFAGGITSLLASGVTSVLGSIAGVIALVRNEPKSWLATAGLIVNVPVALFAIFVFVMAQVRGGG